MPVAGTKQSNGPGAADLLTQSPINIHKRLGSVGFALAVKPSMSKLQRGLAQAISPLQMRCNPSILPGPGGVIPTGRNRLDEVSMRCYDS